MTQIPATKISQIPARRRSVPALPVLIQVPSLSLPRSPRRRARRRRLRREVRLVGYALLGALPIWLSLAMLGGDRLAPLAASSLTAATGPEESRSREVPAVSLSLEPVASIARDQDAPVFLLPAEPTEEDGDGRY